MKTATRALILASLFGAGCSGSGESTLPGNTPDGTPTGVPTVPGQPPVTPGTATPPGGTAVTPGTGNPPVTPPGTTPPTGSTDVPPPPDTGTCKVGVPATSQIPRLTNLQYDTVVRDIFGVTAPGGTWSADFEPDSKGELTSGQWSQYKSAADKIAEAAMATSIGTELTTAAASKDALTTAIKSLGRKMLRRPLTDAEAANFASLFDVQPAGTPAEIAEEVIYAMLVSPSFLMRTELDAPEEVIPGTEASPTMAFKLSSHEVASRLSFLIWNSIPDQALFDAADADALQTKEQITAQAERMIGEEFRSKVTPVVSAALRHWATIDETNSLSRWGKTTHDKTRFPEYSEAQNAPLLAEMDAFFAEVGYDGPFEQLFLSNVAYVNQDTAPLYGVEGNFGPELQRVELDAMERPGFLTRAGFLGSYAHEGSTAPILRGAYIITLMGGQTGVPDPSALMKPVPDLEYKTNRELYDARTKVEPACEVCHTNIINPPGFVLENYSAIGTIQDVDPEFGGPIDTKVDAVAFPDGAKPINNAFELMSGIAAGRRTKEIYAEKWVSYATGRSTNDYDKCTSNAIADKLEAGQYANLAGVLADITQAESFRLRVAAQ